MQMSVMTGFLAFLVLSGALKTRGRSHEGVQEYGLSFSQMTRRPLLFIYFSMWFMGPSPFRNMRMLQYSTSVKLIEIKQYLAVINITQLVA